MAGKIPIENKLLGSNGKKSGNASAQPQGMQGSSGVKSKSTFTPEKVADLPLSFNLSNALDKAYNKVIHYMNDMLETKDLEVNMTLTENTEIGHVTDKLTGEKISSYDGKEMLRLYAHNHQIKGIVVDGKI